MIQGRHSMPFTPFDRRASLQTYLTHTVPMTAITSNFLIEPLMDWRKATSINDQIWNEWLGSSRFILVVKKKECRLIWCSREVKANSLPLRAASRVSASCFSRISNIPDLVNCTLRKRSTFCIVTWWIFAIVGIFEALLSFSNRIWKPCFP